MFDDGRTFLTGVPEMVDSRRQQELDDMARSDTDVRAAARDAASPDAARRHLGDLLRGLRKETDLTLSDVAKKMQRSTATMSRLERGTSPEPREIEVNALLDFYEDRKPGLVSGQDRAAAHTLVELSRAGNWFDAYRDVWAAAPSADQLRRFIGLETYASSLAAFQTELIPGLLQTSAYAKAMAEVHRPDDPRAQERFVEFRMERQRRIGDRLLHFVIAEAALRRDPGLGTGMREQLELLEAELSDGRPNVTIQIAPTSLSIPAATSGPFVIARLIGNASDVVYLEHRGGADFVESPRDVARYEVEFGELTSESLDNEGSLDLVRGVLSRPES